MVPDLDDRCVAHTCGGFGVRGTGYTSVIEDFGKSLSVRVRCYRCTQCGKSFVHPEREKLTPPRVSWTRRVVHAAIALRRCGAKLEPIVKILNRRVSKPLCVSTLHGWTRRWEHLFPEEGDAAVLQALDLKEDERVP